jgi:lipoyl(octanoyl) transferase
MSLSDGANENDELWVCDLDVVPYREAVSLQEELRERRIADEIPDTLLLLEHPPVYTRGRRAGADELTLGEAFYRARGIDVVDTRRGGRVTYHAPGQLVGYAIMRVEDVATHLRRMESAIVEALAREGLLGRSRCAEGPDYTGVWVGERKIASIGVHVSRGVSTHGFAVNVENDLAPFSWVVACGLPDVSMTSIATELAATHSGQESAVTLEDLRERVAASFSRAHALRAVHVMPERLGIAASLAAGLAERALINPARAPRRTIAA